MPKIAHIRDGAVWRVKTLTDAEFNDIPDHKRRYLLRYVEAKRPEYDPATHHAPVRQDDLIGQNEVRQVWADPVAKTRDELDAEQEAHKDAALEPVARNGDLWRAVAGILLGLVNAERGREVPPKDPLTPQQFRAYLRSKL